MEFEKQPLKIFILLLKGVNYKMEKTIYNGMEFNYYQIAEILLGNMEGIDTSNYTDPKISYQEMQKIRLRLVEDKKIKDSWYENFGLKQINGKWMSVRNIKPCPISEGNCDKGIQILLGLKKGLDVSIYAKPEFSGLQMQEIRLGLEKGLDVSIYAKPEYSHHQMDKILFGLERGLDVSIYAKPEFDCCQMNQIICFLVRGFDINKYLDAGITSSDMLYEAGRGLNEGIDLFDYAKQLNDSTQLYEILMGIRKGIDVSVYAKPEFSTDQMCQIRIGLERGLDVSAYAKPELKASVMKQIRFCLQKGLDMTVHLKT